MASDAAPEARHKPDPSHYKRDGKMDWFGYGMNVRRPDIDAYARLTLA